MTSLTSAVVAGVRQRRAEREFWRAVDAAPTDSVRADLLHVWQSRPMAPPTVSWSERFTRRWAGVRRAYQTQLHLHAHYGAFGRMRVDH